MISKLPASIQVEMRAACDNLGSALSTITFANHFKKFKEVVMRCHQMSNSTHKDAAGPVLRWLAFQARRFNHVFGPWKQVGLTDHSLAESSNANVKSHFQEANCSLLYAVRDMVYLTIEQEQQLNSLVKFGSLRAGLMSQHQDNVRACKYRRHVAEEFLMELLLQSENTSLDKLSACQLFLPTVERERMPTVGDEDAHMHKENVTSSEQADMEQSVRESFENSQLKGQVMQPWWPQPQPVMSWNAARQVLPTTRVALDGTTVRQQTHCGSANNRQAGLAQRMNVKQWMVASDTGHMQATTTVITTLLRQRLMLQRVVHLRRLASEPSIAANDTHNIRLRFGMWPHCSALECQELGVVCQHLRFVYKHHLGFEWEHTLPVQTCLTMREATTVLSTLPSWQKDAESSGSGQQGASQQATALHRLIGLDAPYLNGLVPSALQHIKGTKWKVSVSCGNTLMELEVDQTNLVPPPSPPMPPRGSAAKRKWTGTSNLGSGANTSTHANTSSAGMSNHNNNSTQAEHKTGSRSAVALTCSQAHAMTWYVCRVLSGIVTCKGQYAKTPSPMCNSNPKQNVQKGQLALVAKGYSIHSGQGRAGQPNCGHYKKFTKTPKLMYFCMDPRCTRQYQFKPHSLSPNKLSAFCFDLQQPSLFPRPTNLNTRLGPGTVLSAQEHQLLWDQLGVSFQS